MSDRDGQEVVDLTTLGRALGHPLRVRILAGFLRLTRASPVMLARDLAEPLGNVAYHVRYLVGLDILVLRDTSAARGAVVHMYELRPEFSELLPRVAALTRKAGS